MRYIDITGQRFGQLQVETVAGRNAQGNRLWHCRCTCGRQVIVSGTYLRQGRKQSCGHCGSPRVIDLTGQHFGRLVVLKRSKRHSPNGNAQWTCRCACGRQVIVDSQRLRQGRTKSCGCLRNELAKQRTQTNQAFQLKQGNVAALRDDDGVFLCSKRKTKRNQTGVVGVSYDKHSGCYVARLRYHGRYVLNKTAPTLREAAALRHQAEQRYFSPSNKGVTADDVTPKGLL